MKITFVAIDSSLANTGVAVGFIENEDIVIEKINLVSTSKDKTKQIRVSSDTVNRCRQTHRFVLNILNEVKPDVIFVETPSGSQMANGMKNYGATCQLIAALEPEPFEVTPIEVKVGSVNDKTASKQKIINWAYNLYPSLGWLFHAGKLQDKNEHMADAIAIAYAASQTPEFKRFKQIVTKGTVI